MDIDNKSVQNTDINNGSSSLKQVKVNTAMTEEQLKYIQEMINLLGKIQIDKEKGINVLPTEDMSYFLNVCINFTCNSYMQLLADTNVLKNIPTKEAKKQFIAFRAKYMQFPIDAQLEDIKRLGLGNAKKV